MAEQLRAATLLARTLRTWGHPVSIHPGQPRVRLGNSPGRCRHRPVLRDRLPAGRRRVSVRCRPRRRAPPRCLAGLAQGQLLAPVPGDQRRDRLVPDLARRHDALVHLAGLDRGDRVDLLAAGLVPHGALLGLLAAAAVDLRPVGIDRRDHGADHRHRLALDHDCRAARGLGVAERPAGRGTASDPRRHADDAVVRLPGAGDRLLLAGQHAGRAGHA